MIILPKLTTFLIFIILRTSVTQSHVIAKRDANSKVLLCMYLSESTDHGTLYDEASTSSEEFDPNLCTHLGFWYSYPDVKAGATPTISKYMDEELGGYKRAYDMKMKNPNLKTLLYLVTFNRAPSFKEISKNPDNRKEFAQNIAKYLKEHNFDGVGITWFGSSSEEIGENLVALLKDVNEAFERFTTEMKTSRSLIVLQIFDKIENTIENGHYNFSEINKYVDFIVTSPQAIDGTNYLENNLSHLSPLYSIDPALTKYSVDYMVTNVIKKGSDPNKVLINIPTYGSRYVLKNLNDTSIGSPADTTSDENVLPYHKICEKLKNGNNWKVVHPIVTYSGPYAYRGKDWFSFDDPEMVRVKARYVNAKGIRGISIWFVTYDDFRGNCFGKKYPLTTAAKSALFNISYEVPIIINTNQTSSGFGLSETLEKDRRANGCELPLKKVLKMEYELTCAQEDLLNDCKLKREDSLVSQYTTLGYSCYENYVLDSNETSSICLNKAWVPALTPCKKTCRNLRPVNLNLKCGYKHKPVDCNGVMNPGTIVLPRCNPGYRTPLVPDYETILCQDNGEWNDVLFKCVPACGHVAVNVTPLVHGGRIAKYGEFPWHIGIYDKTSNNQLICGGTIISSLLVVSAAHCFSDRQTGRIKNPTNYEVAVGKYSINRTVDDSQFTKFFSVKRIHFHDYHGIEFRFENDIAILELTNRIEFNDFVLPACVYFQTTTVPEIFPGELLMTAGWGIDETGQQSQTLKVATLPYLNTRDCLNAATAGVTDFLSKDKFCAGNHSGEAVDQGDSGGGLMYKDPQTKRFYLYGIVSIKATGNTPIAIFTNVANHANWLKNKRDNIQKSTP